MASAKTINLKVLAQTDAFAKKLAELPGMTEREAKKAGKKLAKQFEKAEKAAAKNATNTAKEWDKAFSQLHVGGTKFGSVIKALKSPQLALAAGIGAVVTAGFKAAEAMSAYTDGIVNLAASTGMSVESVAGLEFAAKGAGIELSTMETGLRALAKRAGEAAIKGGTAAKAFERIGVDVKDSRGQLKGMDALLAEVVDGLSAMGNATESAAIAQEILGGRGVMLAAALSDGSGALTEWTERVREAGIVSEEMQIASKRMDAAQAELAFSARAAGQTFGKEFVPAVTRTKKIMTGALNVLNQSVQGYAQLGERIALLNDDYAEAIRVENEMTAAGELLRSKNAEVASSMRTMSDAAIALQQSLGAAVNEVSGRRFQAWRDLRREISGTPPEVNRLSDALERNRSVVISRRAAMLEAGALDADARSQLEDLQRELDETSRLEEELTVAKERSAAASKRRAERSREQAAAELVAEASAEALTRATADWNDQVLRMTEGGAAADLVKRLQEIGEAQMLGAISAEQATMFVTAANAAHLQSIEDIAAAELQAAKESRDIKDEKIAGIKEEQQAKVSAVMDSAVAITGALKDAAGDDFRAQQALAISEVLMRSAVGVVNILSGAGGPIIKGAQLAALAAATAVSTAEIANQQPPKMHTGGIIPDERPARLLTGEGVLSRQGVAALGGPGAVHAANAGQGMGGTQVIQMVYKHRVLDTVMRDQLKTDSSLRRAIKGGTRLGHR